MRIKNKTPQTLILRNLLSKARAVYVGVRKSEQLKETRTPQPWFAEICYEKQGHYHVRYVNQNRDFQMLLKFRRGNVLPITL